MTCDEARKEIPFYAARTLSFAEEAALVEHVAGCPSCQGELVEALRLAHVLRQAQDPGPPPGLWLAVASRTVGVQVLGFHVGPEVGGIRIEVQAGPGGPAVSGSLSLGGRQIKILTRGGTA